MKGKLIKNKYFILQTLGQNSFSETFLARDQRWFIRRRYIIKKFRPILGNSQITGIQRLFYQEASVLQRLKDKSSQIPRLYEYFMDGEDFFIVREWIDGLTLKQKVQQQGVLPPAEVEQILRSILACLEHIHSYGIVYRQLTPSSIILRPSSKGYLPVPIYFGGVKELNSVSSQPQKLDGQLHPLLSINQPKQPNLVLAERYQYRPPEQEHGKSLFASDLYSLGLTAIYLLTGKTPGELPFDSQSKRLLWHQAMPQLDIHLARVIDRAICTNMQSRFINATQMLYSLNSRPVNISMPQVESVNCSSHSHLASDLKIIAALLFSGLSVLVITFMFLQFDSMEFSQSNLVKLVSDSQDNKINSEVESLSDLQAITANQIPAFSESLSQRAIIRTLGTPTQNSQENQQVTNLLLYQNFMTNVDLAYLTDQKTQQVDQVKIVFADSVELKTIYGAAQQLLRTDYSADVEHYINQVYFNTSDRLDFQLNNFEGVIRRDSEQKIHLSIRQQ
ncbi:MAG: serine/threonine-protein kinase [Cyanobacteria bacterium P01_G01_bin.39]